MWLLVISAIHGANDDTCRSTHGNLGRQAWTERDRTGDVDSDPLGQEIYGRINIDRIGAADLDTSQIVVGTQMPDGAAAKPRQQT
jgi:hypothetical protein